MTVVKNIISKNQRKKNKFILSQDLIASVSPIPPPERTPSLKKKIAQRIKDLQTSSFSLLFPPYNLKFK